MAGPYGRMCRDLHGASLHIKGKLVLDQFANLHVANAEISNAHITGNVYTNGICEQEMAQGIYVKGNVTLRPGDVLCATTIKATTIIGNIVGTMNFSNVNVSGLLTANTVTAQTIIGDTFGKHTGNVCGNIVGGTITGSTITAQSVTSTGNICGNILLDNIYGKSGNTISVHANIVLTAPNTAVVTDNLYVNLVSEIVTNTGINVIGNICQSSGSIQTSKVEPKVLGNGVIIDTYIPKKRFGLSRAHSSTITPFESGNIVQILLDTKTYESAFTSTRGLVHPFGNTLVTFQAPSTANVNCVYTSAFVNISIGAQFELTSGNIGDCLYFQVRKNTGNLLSSYSYPIFSNLTSTFTPSIAWSDCVELAPDDVVDVFVYTKNNSTFLEGNVLTGSGNTFATFEIKSLE
jgi:hypothetical protein